MGKLTGKTALITGANSGIGRATAILFASEGAHVVLVARRLDKLTEVEQEITAANGSARCVAADVSNMQDCAAAVSAAVAAYGQIDILVNNAGIADKHKPVTRCDAEWWDEVCAVNQNSVFYMTKEVLKNMEPAERGSIVNISSIGGVFGNSGIAYSAAKSAVIGMTKNIAIQFAGKGIRCNAVCPGPTPTALNTPDKLAEFDLAFADICSAHMDTSLPEANVEDQANAILFFAGDESKAVTGQILIVDHGATL